MDRRAFLKSSGLTAVGSLAASSMTATTSLAGMKISESAQILRLGHVPGSDTAFDTALSARRIAEQLESTTNGAIQAVATSADQPADVMLANPQHLKQANPDWAALMPLVHGLGPQTFDRWYFTGGGDALTEELAHDAGVVALPAGRASTLHKLHASAYDDGGELVISTTDEELELTGTDVSWRRPSPIRKEHPTITLPEPLAGEPIFLIFQQDALSRLNATAHPLLSVITKAEYGVVAAEADVTAMMDATYGSPAPQKALLPTFASRLAHAVEARRHAIMERNGLGRRILESQQGFKAMTSPHELSTQIDGPIA